MKIVILGIDLGKNGCSVVGLDEGGAVILRRRMRRDAVFGLIGLWQATECRMRRRSELSLQPVVMAFMGLVAANIVIYVALSGGIAWEAHLDGWIVGWLSGQSFARR